MSDLTDTVSNKNFHQLLKANIQFEIPFFQRGYAWEKKHWDQLFDDIEEQIRPELDSVDQPEDAEHFFGPIVVLEKTNADLELKRFQVIDGQQRITTVYLLLSVIRKLISEKSHSSTDANEHLEKLKHYLENNIDHTHDDYRRLKLLSGKGDRFATYLAIFDTNPMSPQLALDQSLYVPGKNQIDQFKEYAYKQLKKRYPSVTDLWQLAEILLKSLKLVWISLKEGKDDPQAIFESLNDRGMPLSASELLCNFLFRPLINESTGEHQQLHTDLWLTSLKQVGDNFDDYIRTYFSIGEKKVIGKGRRTYVHFKNKNRTLTRDTAMTYLRELHDNAKLYNQMIEPERFKHEDPMIWGLLIKISNTRMDASHTLVLATLRALKLNKLSVEDGRAILQELYVLLARRKMCELATQKYDTLLPNMLDKIINEPNKAKAMHTLIAAENYWVSDQEFHDALIHKPLYRTRDLPFTRMVLQEIDRTMQSFGQLPDYSTLETVEHVLPQTLSTEWEAYLGNDASDPELARYTDTLGNLCLLSGPANSHAGQNPFEQKQIGYSDVSALTRDIKSRRVHWSISEIQHRSEDLAKYALKVFSWSYT